MKQGARKLCARDVKVVGAWFDSEDELVSISVETPEESMEMFPEHVVIALRKELAAARFASRAA